MELAAEVGRTLGAHLLGVDILRTPRGPMIVDINDPPGLRGVADAVPMVSAHLREHAAAYAV